MPVYEYECRDCGSFQAVRPMSEYSEPCACPACGSSAPRALLTAPGLTSMDSSLRLAHATNERSAHEPHLSSKQGRAHGPGCSCCSGGKKSSAVYRPDGSKTFPSKRPWMISH